MIDKEKARARQQAYLERHPERRKATCHAYYLRNRQKIAAARRAWEEKNADRVAGYQRKYRAANPEKFVLRQRAFYAADPERAAAYQRSYRERHPERCAEIGRNYRKTHPEKRREFEARRRARLRGGLIVQFTEEQLEQRLSMFGHKCWICGEEGPEMDHVKPLAKGGPHILANLRPACGPCNRSKNNRWPLVAEKE